VAGRGRRERRDLAAGDEGTRLGLARRGRLRSRGRLTHAVQIDFFVLFVDLDEMLKDPVFVPSQPPDVNEGDDGAEQRSETRQTGETKRPVKSILLGLRHPSFVSSICGKNDASQRHQETGGGGEGADGNEGPFPAWREVEDDEKDDGQNGDDYVDRHEELHHAKPHGSDLVSDVVEIWGEIPPAAGVDFAVVIARISVAVDAKPP